MSGVPTIKGKFKRLFKKKKEKEPLREIAKELAGIKQAIKDLDRTIATR